MGQSKYLRSGAAPATHLGGGWVTAHSPKLYASGDSFGAVWERVWQRAPERRPIWRGALALEVAQPLPGSTCKARSRRQRQRTTGAARSGGNVRLAVDGLQLATTRHYGAQVPPCAKQDTRDTPAGASAGIRLERSAAASCRSPGCRSHRRQNRRDRRKPSAAWRSSSGGILAISLNRNHVR